MILNVDFALKLSIIHCGNVLHVSNESWKCCSQHYILSSTTKNCRSLPLIWSNLLKSHCGRRLLSVLNKFHKIQQNEIERIQCISTKTSTRVISTITIILNPQVISYKKYIYTGSYLCVFIRVRLTSSIPSNICISFLKSDMVTFMHYLPKVCGSNLWNSIFSIFLWDNVTKFFLIIDKRFLKINIQKGTYTCKVVISICLFVCLFVCMSNHHSSTPWPSGLKFYFDFLLCL